MIALEEQSPLRRIRSALEHVCQQLDAEIEVHADDRPAASLSRYCTVKETADVIQASPASVRRWIRNGRLRAVKLAGNRVYRIRPDWIQDVLDKS